MWQFYRFRVAVFAATATGVGYQLWAASWHKLTEYYSFAYGGMVLAGRLPHYTGASLHLYADHPELQIGPLPLAVNAAIARLPIDVQQAVWIAIIFGCALVTIRAVEVIRRQASAGPVPRWLSMLDGFIVLGAFSALAWFFHLDDAIALTGITVAAACITTRRPSWLSALTLGVAASAKPWAVMAAPLLLAAPGVRRAAVVYVAAAIGPWLPFIVADTRTVQALTFLPYQVSSWSGLRVWGFSSGAFAPHPLHSMELLLGTLLGVLAVRRGRWLAVPLVALSARMLLEPRFYLYYGAAPVLAALIWDVSGRRRFPWWTFTAAGVEFGLVYVASPLVVAVAQVTFAVVLMVVLLRPPSPVLRWVGHRSTAGGPQGHGGPPASTRDQPAGVVI